MEPISGMISGAIRPPAAAADVEAPPKVRRPGEQTQDSPIRSAKDEYIPEEKQEPSGLYWLGKDEDGQPKVYFDDPDRADSAPETQDELPAADGPDQDKGADGPEKKASDSRKAEICRGSTDKVDREIEKLKKKREELERQINSETDETKLKGLKKKLAQVEGELRQKDNDAYRRQHTEFS